MHLYFTIFVENKTDIMNFTFKKVLPEEVFVTIESAKLPEQRDEEGNMLPTECPNKISGVEFMDVFARLLWHYPYADIGFYADKMQLSTKNLNQMVLTLSGITTVEWRDRYVNMAARELLEHSMTSIGDVAKRLCFTNIHTFSRYFSKHNSKSPKYWRYAVRGFNNDRIDILRYQLKKANELIGKKKE